MRLAPPLLWLAVFGVSGCGGSVSETLSVTPASPTATASPGSGTTAAPIASAAPTPSSNPTPNALVADPASLQLAGVGTASALRFTVSEASYVGTFSETDTCGGVATVSPAAANGPSATFTITGLAGGTCAARLSDAIGQSVPVAIAVTVSNASVTGKER
jgi:hypothetical protein